jgi:polyisoprenoid-binding protein YceI
MSATVNQQTAVATTWAIDSVHSNVEFAVKHMMISTVKGQFSDVEGTLEWDGENFETASVSARIDTSSVTTFNEMRDNHLRTNDFFNAEQWPDITFQSTRIEVTGDDELKIHGDLTIRDITRPVVLDTEFDGLLAQDAFGKARAAFTATAQINRKDYGVNWNQALEAGGIAVSDKVKITLHIAAVR